MCISFTLRNHSHGKIHRKNPARVLATMKNQRSKAGGGGKLWGLQNDY